MDKIIQLANKAMNMLDVTELNNKDKTLITDVIHKIRSEALTLTDVGCSLPSKEEIDFELNDLCKKKYSREEWFKEYEFRLGFMKCVNWYDEKMKK